MMTRRRAEIKAFKMYEKSLGTRVTLIELLCLNQHLHSLNNLQFLQSTI